MDDFDWLKDKIARLAGFRLEIAELNTKVNKRIYVIGSH